MPPSNRAFSAGVGRRTGVDTKGMLQARSTPARTNPASPSDLSRPLRRLQWLHDHHTLHTSYIHDRTYLPERGWWDNKERNARLAKGVKFCQQASRYNLLPKLPAILAKAAKPGDWRDDPWVDGRYAEEAPL
ncbi:hypothetical protein FKP32DRAFT_1679106 [Trametes sanguinea]|nr:hypothetical protein FKP32DRAFT_1679106 [Trametes sanguinea]